jgi:drug/metabolite transporter (DMT)-like permease
MGDISPGAGVAVGIIVGLLSTGVQSVGLTLQRKSHMLEDSKEDHMARRAPYRRRRWQIGMSLFLLANIIGSTIQITTLPLPLLSTLQASGLVFNSIMASLILKEAWTYRTLVGTALVAGGAVLISPARAESQSGAIATPAALSQLPDLVHPLAGVRGWRVDHGFLSTAFYCGA